MNPRTSEDRRDVGSDVGAETSRSGDIRLDENFVCYVKNIVFYLVKNNLNH